MSRLSIARDWTGLNPLEGRLRGHLFGQATYFGFGDTTTRLRGGAEARFTLTRDTALHLTFSAHRSYGESWIESGARFVVHF